MKSEVKYVGGDTFHIPTDCPKCSEAVTFSAHLSVMHRHPFQLVCPKCTQKVWIWLGAVATRSDEVSLAEQMTW